MGPIQVTAALSTLVSLVLSHAELPGKLEGRSTSTATYRRRALQASESWYATAGDDSNADVLLVAVLNDRLYIEGGEISIYNETDDTLAADSYWRTVLSTANYSSRH